MNNYSIYKILREQNENLIDCVFDLFENQKKLDQKTLNALKISTATAKNDSYLGIKECVFDLVYVVVCNNLIYSTFTHKRQREFNQIYLDQATTHAKHLGKGFGSMVYADVIKDIFLNFRPDSICATSVSEMGRRFLQKLNFYPNTDTNSYLSNAILYNPTLNKSVPLVPLDYVNKFIPARKMLNSPNVDDFNLRIKKLTTPEILKANKFKFIKQIAGKNRVLKQDKNLCSPYVQSEFNLNPAAMATKFRLNHAKAVADTVQFVKDKKNKPTKASEF